MIKLRLLIIFFLFLPFISIPIFANDIENTEKHLHIQSKINKLYQEQIYKERAWLVLIHYKDEKEGRYSSYADSQSFFLSLSGKNSPSDELEETLKALSSNINDSSIECNFPARFHWIRERFSIDQNLFPKPNCPKFEEFYNQMKAKSLSVVFASFHPEHPASLFGHTMLKFNSENGEMEELEDVVVTYAAVIPRIIDPITYVFDGLFGGFPGSFEIQKYKYKIYEYNEYENRNLWEYKLSIDSKGIDKVIRHLWEMQRNHFDYYFFDENCSFRILTLLEVANSELYLSNVDKLLVQPADTIKLISAQSNLLKEVKFRPSIIERYRQKFGFLNEAERKLLNDLIENDTEIDLNIGHDRKSILYDAAIDYLLIKKSMEKGTLNENDKEKYSRYNQLRGDTRYLTNLSGYYNPPTSSNPLLGHASSQIMLSGGNSSNGSFAELSVRPVLRDFTDSYPGYSPYNQLFFLSTNVRTYENGKTPRLQEMHLIQMTSLNPIGQLINKASWRFDTGLKSLLTEKNFKVDPGVLYGFSSFGFGVATEPFFYLSRYSLVLYSFIDIRGDISNTFDRGYRIGSIVTIGALCRINERLSFHLVGDYRSYSIGEKQYFPEVWIQSNYLLMNNFSLEIQYKKVYSTSLDEARFGAKLYF